MKKTILSRIVLLCSLCILTCSVRAQYVAIPDSSFGNWLNANGYDTCLTGSSTTGWQLDTSCAAILHAYTISCNGDSIADLTGIRYFKNIGSLFCERNKLTFLPVLPASLYTLNCSFNLLASLANIPPSLHQLDCSYNQLTGLPAMPASIRSVYCNNNLISSLPSLPLAMQDLVCADNNLPSLPAILPDSLVFLDCSGNGLSALPLLPSVLRNLQCYNNQLTAMPALPDSLGVLTCSNNQLDTLPALPPFLLHLDCSFNSLSQLPALPYFLVTLYCENNRLSALPYLTDTISDINCSYNLLTALPNLPYDLLDINCSNNTGLSCLPIIYQAQLGSFYIDSTAIQCIPDRVTATYFDTNPDSMQVCTQASGCPFQSTTGIKPFLTDNISLYPNPNKGSFTLQTTGSIHGEYTITDMLGHVITQQAITADRQAIDMSGAAEGVYTLTVRGAQPLRFTIVR